MWGLHPVLGVGEVEFAGHGFAVSEEADDLEDIGPCGEHAVIAFFERVDGHEEQELFWGHLAFFGGLGELGEAASSASFAFESGGGVFGV